jgi:preprotein translocase subunit SecF
VEIFKKKTHYDFVGHLPAFQRSSAVSSCSRRFSLVHFKGLNFGTEFAGGTEALAAMTAAHAARRHPRGR